MKRDALIVGIDRYPFLQDTPNGKPKHLKTPAGDAEAIAQLLETYGDFRVKRLPESNIDGKLQVDPGKPVKAEELQKAIANLFQPNSGRTPETALLFFAGHGLRNTTGNQPEGYLATSDTSPRKDKWGVSLQWLRQLLQESGVRQQIIWLDCCHSGELLNFRETELGGQWLGRDRETSHKDRFFLAASRDYEVAYQQLDSEHGVLSGAILKGLDPYQDPGYEWITNSTLAGAVEREIERTKIPQSPLIVNYGETIHLIQKKGRTPFITSEDFFRGWLDSDKPFNHAWKLEGRTDYLQSLHEFIESSQERIAILPGRSGIGKTKLLHAFAEQFEHSEFILRFVEEGVSVTRENIDNLPVRPCVVVLDDAHRREQDVSTLLTLVQRRTDIKLLLSSRPYAVNYLAKILRDAGINSRQIQRMDELRELSREDVKALARQALGSDYAHLAAQLASVTKDCPLVTVVGGRLLAEKAIPPGLLERDEDFQHDVLNRFQNEFVGKVSQRIEPTLCRKLLNLIAAVAPIRLNNEIFKQVAAEFLKIEGLELVSYIGILEQSGILRRRGDTLRITPDVLADHILHEACLTPQGELTGYAREVFEKLQNVCPTELLLNLAELDWRIRHTSDGETDLLADLWQEIREEFRIASNSGRYHLLNLLKEVAYYQPKQMLRLVELAMREPATTPEDESYSNFYTHSRVLYQLPELLRRISYTLEYLPCCCDLLWKLGRDDSQELDSYPEHARRVLVDLAKYDIDKSPIFNQKVLEAVARWLKKTDAGAHIDILLDILDPLLVKSFRWTYTEGLTVHFRSSYVSREKTQSIRDRALTLIAQFLNSEQPKVILRSLNSLKKALQVPGDFLAQRHNEQVEQWISEQLKILQLISELTVKESNPLIHLEIIKSLKLHIRRSSSQVVKERSQAIITSISDSYALRLTGVLLSRSSYGLDWLLHDEEKSKNYDDKYEQYINETCLNIAREFLKRHPEAYEGVQILNRELQNIKDIGAQPEPSSFFDNLCKVIEPSYAIQMCEAIIEIGDCPLALYLDSLLSQLRLTDINRAIILSQCALNTKIPALCISIARVYLYCGENLQSAEFELIQILLAHPYLRVKLIAINSLRKLVRLQPQLTIKMALDVDIDKSTELANALCQIFHTNIGVSPDLLTHEELDRLLSKLEIAAAIDEYHIREFIAYTSKRLPRSLVQFFIKRIERDEEDEKGEYQPLPFQGFQNRLEGIAKSHEYKDILRDVRNQALKRTHTKKKWLPVLFKEISLVPNHTDLDRQYISLQRTSPNRSFYKDKTLALCDRNRKLKYLTG